MKRILITGMSGTGKSTVIERLAALGRRAVDADTPAWSEWAPIVMPGAPPDTPPELDWIWQEDRMRRLLETAVDGALYVTGCAANQGRFYGQFDSVVLLSAPTEVILDRIATRTTNHFGKSAVERAKILEDIRTVEPLLRAGADIEIDTSVALLDDVVATLIALADGEAAPDG